MDNQTEGIIRQNGDESTVLDSANVTPTVQCEHGEESTTTNSVDASPFSNDSQAVSVDEEPKLPILKKFEDLSNKIQTLRKEHTTLSNEVKDFTSNQFPGFEVLNTFQQLSEEHELLKKKYTEESELLKKKYVEEYGERKRLYNEVIELKGNIRVFCRCRPLNQEEIANGSTSVVEISPSQEQELTIAGADSSKKLFKFDHVFGPHANQEDVFAQTSPIVTSVLDGYNVCIFAYGQTGTGKTFTMEGTPENRGVNYRTLEKLFSSVSQRSGTMRYELFVSMLEVYNEKIRDLLVENTSEPPKKLEIKQAPEGTHEIPGLVEACVHGTDEVWELLKTGSRVRSVGSTNANECSSRSHCLLRVTVKGENLLNGQRTKSNLWLVDLAGSERVGRIEVEGERLKESQFINKSLSALGDVISSLASKSAHVPYRNSKLTHMLQSSLGGDCKTLMFVQISPSDADLGETLCSLNFASRVKGIEHGPARKQTDHAELLKYKHLAEKSKHDEKETKKLQENVQSLQLRLSCREHHCRSLQEKVRELENQLAEERRKSRQKQESLAADAAAVRQPRPGSRNTIEKKPPLGPSNTRMPLRKLSNFVPQPASAQTKKASNFSSFFSSSYNGKENTSNGSNTSAAIRGPRRFSVAVRQPSSEMTASSLQPKRRVSVGVRPPPPPSSPPSEATESYLRPRRRVSVAVRPASSETMAPSLLPRRRVSIATMRPDLSSQPATPKQESSIPGRALFREVSKDTRVRRYSKLFSSLPESRAGPSSSVEATPMASKSRFMGSPPTEHTPWRPKHPTVVALQKKPVVWSPLQSKVSKNTRKSVV